MQWVNRPGLLSPLLFSNEMKPFSALTVRGQAARLRHLALETLQHYDLEQERLSLVNND